MEVVTAASQSAWMLWCFCQCVTSLVRWWHLLQEGGLAWGVLLGRRVSPLFLRVAGGVLGLVLAWATQLSPPVILHMGWEFTGTGAVPSWWQVCFPPLLGGSEWDRQAGPELFSAFGLSNRGWFWLHRIHLGFIPLCLLACCGNSGEIPDSFYSLCLGRCQDCSIYI